MASEVISPEWGDGRDSILVVSDFARYILCGPPSSPSVGDSAPTLDISQCAREKNVKIDGLITVRSRVGHRETLARFEAAVRANGLHIVAGVDHAIAAFEAGVSLDATMVLMVGDGRRQAALVNALRLTALELPFKVLVWQDAGGIWLSYIDFRRLAKRYRAGPEEVCLITDLAVMIDAVVRKAASPP
jgi:uncharacterized protein (DUF302 family)